MPLPRRALLLAGAAAAWPARAQQRSFALGLLTQADDERYGAQLLQKGFPDGPGGRSAAAARIALNDSAFQLQVTGWTSTQFVPVEAANAASLPAAVQQLLQKGVRHLVLELPARSVAIVAAAAAGRDLILFNAAAPEDELRGAQCAPHLLHTLPSHAMQMDALAQLLAARKWNRPLVLHGPLPADGLLRAAFQRSARRSGLRPVAERGFRPPGEREPGDVRLLTAEGEYDAVVVLDTQGEFAREAAYRTVLPRPVLGSNGLVAQAWSPIYELHGAPQLSRRFLRRAGRPMGSYDWATWMAARFAAEIAAAYNKATIAQQLQALRQGAVAVDGYKGQRLTFRAWDGQLRQPLLLAHGNGVADMAPLDGFPQTRNGLDTLGHDAAESTCRVS